MQAGEKIFTDFEFNPENTGQELLEGLNPEQKEAALHDEGPLLILAGAGSGKTRVITHRIAYLVEARSVAARNILAITFTNKAANEMKERVNNLLGSNMTRGMWIGTFHSMMARVLRRFAAELGFTNNFSIADAADQRSLIKETIKDLNMNDKTFEARAVQASISAAKNKLIGPEEYKRQAGDEFWKVNVARIYARYQAKLKENNIMDFDDLLYYPVILFRENPDILRLYQDRFHYIMVDEYQDTNGAQYEIVHLLSQQHKNLCVVGDDDQSIYSFRGANVQNILNFEKDFKHCKIIKLEQNYRSTENILAAANAVINNNTGRKDKALWTDKGEGEKVIRFFASTERDEAVTIAEEIKALVRSGEQNYNDIAVLYRINALSRNLEFCFNQSAVPFKIYGGLRFFERKEIKDIMAYLRLITSPRDDTAFVRAITSPRRGVGDTTIAKMQTLAEGEGISLMELALKIEQYPELTRSAAKVQDFVRLIAEMQNNLLYKDWSLAEYVEYVENASGLIQDIIDNKDKNREQAYTRLENLKELLSEVVNFQNMPVDLFAGEFTDEELAALDASHSADYTLGHAAENGSEYKAGNEADDPKTAKTEKTEKTDSAQDSESLLDSLVRFLEQSALYTDLDQEQIVEDQEGPEDSVSLMTIHSAKGLEFKTVFVIGMDEGIFPGYRSIGDLASLEEERRLVYVAMTRAKEHLYLCSSRQRLLFGRTESYMPSRFLTELPEANIVNFGRADSLPGETSFYSTTYNSPYQAENLSGETKKFANENSSSKFGFSRKHTFAAAPKAEQKGQKLQLNIKKAGNLKAEDIKQGDKVRHAKHGTGTVLAVEPVAGDAILSIRFDNGEEKMMLANSSNLARA